MSETPLLWLVPGLPLLGSAVAGFFGPKYLKQQSHWPVVLGAAGACVIALWVLASSLVWPVVKAVRYLGWSAKLGRRRNRAVATSAGATLLALLALFALPLPLWTNAQGVTWAPEDALVHAGSDGFVRRVVADPGASVKRGRLLIETEDPQLQPRMRALEAQLRELSIRVRTPQPT